jgi:hypothetical protein
MFVSVMMMLNKLHVSIRGAQALTTGQHASKHHRRFRVAVSHCDIRDVADIVNCRIIEAEA